MDFAGWIFIFVSWGGIITLAVFCFIRIFSKKKLN